MPELSIGLATPADDAALRALLRNSPMAGNISVSFEREPDYFAGAQVEAPFYQVIVVRDETAGRIAGLGSRSIREVYLNGQARMIGYLGQFRIHPDYRVMRRALVNAWKFARELHADGRSPFYFTSIIEDNLPARRLLTAGLPGLPTYHEYARMHTLAVYSRRKRRRRALPSGLQVRPATAADVPAIIACLQRNLPRYQFAPHWTSKLLFTPDYTPGLTPKDVLLAVEQGQVVGCLAMWDQRAFKQSVIRGYGGTFQRWRWAINLGAWVLGYPLLPAAGSHIQYGYASHLAVDDDRPEVFMALVERFHAQAVRRGYSYFMLGLADDNPFLPLVTRSYPHIDYPSCIYLVAWEDDLEPLAQVDGRLPGPEISIL